MSLKALFELLRGKPGSPPVSPAPSAPPPPPPPLPPASPRPHAVFTEPWRNWAVILTSLGVPMAAAQKWETEFQDQITPETFGDDAGLAAFLGQVLHESSGLQRLVEDLSYSTADRLMVIWPRRFPNVESTTGLVRNPRALAERVYGGRLGNDAPGDGWAYRGRGLIQITGKANYEAMQVATGEPLVDFPDLLTSPRAALKSAILWFRERVPAGATVAQATQIINGGQIGIEERLRLVGAAKRALLENPWR